MPDRFWGKWFLAIDNHSNWLEVFPINTATSFMTIEKLEQLFANHRLSEIVIADNGAMFTGTKFHKYMQAKGIVLIHTAPYHPVSNGLVERAVESRI